MTVADFISKQKGRPQMVAKSQERASGMVVRADDRVDGLERSRALVRAAEIVLIHFPGDVGEWTLRSDNRTVELDDGTTFQINDL
jgi:hypothetical protein